MENIVTENLIEGTDQVKRRIDWHDPPEYPVLDNSRLDIWRMNLDKITQPERIASLLSADEIPRMESLVIPEKRSAFVTGRYLLRSVLSRYTRLAPQIIRFGYLTNGKPVLADESLACQIQFNLSHSASWAVLAVSGIGPVGIDIEAFQPIRNKNWALENLFSIQDREVIRQQPESQQDTAFITAWTKKEAMVKALGIGLGSSAKACVMDEEQNFDPSGEPCQIYQKSPFWCCQFSPAPGYIGMAVVESEWKPEIRFWDLNANPSFIC